MLIVLFLKIPYIYICICFVSSCFLCIYIYILVFCIYIYIYTRYFSPINPHQPHNQPYQSLLAPLLAPPYLVGGANTQKSKEGHNRRQIMQQRNKNSKQLTERSFLIRLISKSSYLICFRDFHFFDVDHQLDLEISRRMVVSRGRGDDSGAVS